MAPKDRAEMAPSVVTAPERIPLQIHVLSGALARAVSIAALHPIDTIKTTVQAAPSDAYYRSTLGAIKYILDNKGFVGFYQGLPGALTGQIPYAAVTFTTYEVLKENLMHLAPPEASIFVLLACGALGDFCGSVIVVPTEVLKIRVQTGVYKSAIEGMKAVLSSSKGFRDLYTGYASQLGRDLPFRAVQLASFEHLKKQWLSVRQNVPLNPLQNLFVGAFAGSLAAACTCPADVIKTRIMNQAGGVVFKSWGQVAMHIVKHEGPSVLFRGLVPRVVMIGPSSAIFFLVYEGVKSKWRNRAKSPQVSAWKQFTWRISNVRQPQKPSSRDSKQLAFVGPSVTNSRPSRNSSHSFQFGLAPLVLKL